MGSKVNCNIRQTTKAVSINPTQLEWGRSGRNMKASIFLFSLTALTSAAAAAAAESNSSVPNDDATNHVPGRVCPSGFVYLGEDTHPMLSAYWTEEVARSPVYSCYKVMKSLDLGFNEALTTCNDLKADLITLEDEQEVRRVNKCVDSGYFLTSAMFFADVQKWIWLGSNQTEVPFNVTATADKTKEQCLALVAPTGNSSEPIKFRSVECNQPDMGAICEVRVQTVTYLAWFYSNWLSFLLVLMTVLLLSALCISVFKYNSGRRVYRSRSSSRQQRVSVSNLPYMDAPPTYNDVTGRGPTRPSSQQTAMDKYKNKGKEILAKVTLYKNTNETASNAAAAAARPNSS